RRTQEFLLEKNYPPVPDIERILKALNEGIRTLPDLQQHLKMDREVIEQSVDKLLIQAAVTADLDGVLHPVQISNWKANYEQQVGYRRAQIDKIIAYAEGATCRMAALVTHFGDRTDSGKPCGVCDICSPQGTSASDAHQPSASEKAAIRSLLKALQAGPRSAGKICTDLGWKDRKEFDGLTDALARAGLLKITSDSFRTEDGRDITYRKLSLTPEGYEADDDALDTVWLRSEASSGNKSGAISSRGKRAKLSSVGTNASSSRKHSGEDDDPLTEDQAKLETGLKKWRAETARAQGLPPFTVFHDSVLRALAVAKPANLAQLEAIRGIGQDKSNRYGADLLALCRGEEVLAKSFAAPSSKISSKPHALAPRVTGKAEPSVLTQRERAALTRPERAATRASTPVPAKDRSFTPAEQQIETNLRHWRSEQAAASGLPSFFVLSDTALRHLVLAQPSTSAELTGIPGLDSGKIERYGPALLQLCQL
ncbi:MAG TPA: HRDC domain-containing protein, partial [Acidobacteriaceae bacterium]|nr:HRDC domain-containing protein [Acidobacteriaceae bacterium]